MGELASGTRRITDLGYDARFPELSAIEEEWDNLIYGSASSSDSPLKTAARIEESLAVLDDPNGLVQLSCALGVLRDVWQGVEKTETLRAVVTLAEISEEEVEIFSETNPPLTKDAVNGVFWSSAV